MHEVIDLDGTNVARGRCQRENGTKVELELTIVAPSGFAGNDGRFYYPAESITFFDIIAVEALAALCNRLVRAHAELTEARLSAKAIEAAPLAEGEDE